MVNWTKKHPFGTFLLNSSITVLGLIILYFLIMARLGDTLDKIKCDTGIIKTHILSK